MAEGIICKIYLDFPLVEIRIDKLVRFEPFSSLRQSILVTHIVCFRSSNCKEASPL